MNTLKIGVCLAGFATTISVAAHAAQYSIETLPDPITEAAAINARGDIVGDSFVYEHRTHTVTTLPCSGTGCNVYGA